jgi:ABC-type lipoprotein export system ATPase subunit
MDEIKTCKLKPSFLSDAEPLSSDRIWFNDVCFKKRERCLISASSGQGKSSFLSFIFGERNDYSGSIYFDDKDVSTLTATEWQTIRKQHISIVFQGLRLFSELTALENIQLKNNITEYRSQEDIDRLIEKSGLQDKRNEKTGRLSFGQQQRVAIIRALCQPFEFILLDEPFSHLDKQNIALMTEIITDELRSHNAGMIVCSLGDGYLFNYDRHYNI